MSQIIPTGPSPANAAASPASTAPQAGPDFASILAGTVLAGFPQPPSGGNGGGRDHSLRDQIAAMFNEFGFFPAPPGEEHEPRWERPGGPGGNLGHAVEAIVEHAAERPRPQAQAPAPHSPDVPPAQAPAPGGEAAAGDALASTVEAVGTAAPAHIIANGPQSGPGRAGAGWTGNPPRLHLAPGSQRATPFTSRAPTQPPQAGDGAQEAAGAARPGACAPTEAKDRIAFRIGDHLVELVARLDGLSKEEEKKLVDALHELLASHGLSLSAATINGRAFAASLLGSQR